MEFWGIIEKLNFWGISEKFQKRMKNNKKNYRRIEIKRLSRAEQTFAAPLRVRLCRCARLSLAPQAKAEKRAYKLYLYQLLGAELALPVEERKWRPGTVMGVKPKLVYVTLDAPPVEIRVYPRDLSPEAKAALVTSLGVGVRVRVSGHDDAKDRWMFDCERL